MAYLEGINTLLPEELNQWKSDNDDFVLIHTLPSDHYAKTHIAGANNACVYEVIFQEKVNELVPDKAKKIVLYGSSNKSFDAAVAAEKLKRLDYQHIYVLEGGLKGWQAAGYSLEGSEPYKEIVLKDQLLLKDGDYRVDTENSMIEWSGRNPNTKHFGTIGLSEGQIRVKGQNITGKFAIDMHSIRNINLEGDELQPVLVNHLESDDFFFVKLFPEASFTLESARLTTDPALTFPNYTIQGSLELRGIRKAIEFPATLSVTEDHRIIAESHFDIDRTRWKVIYGSSRFFEHLGMHLVFDLISLQVKIATI